METLNRVDIVLPDHDSEFFSKLINFLNPFGVNKEESFLLKPSNPEYLPLTRLKSGPVSIPEVVFNEKHVQIVNITGVEKENPLEYSPLSLDEVVERLSGTPLNMLDHVGFNLPYFDGVHPKILALRDNLKEHCLYHLFPSGEAWDFIIPGTVDEIQGKSVDYSLIRKPKFEIVSFDICSRPLIQIDFSVKTSYNEITSMFPEGIHDDNLHNVWVYVQNPYDLDICFVVNEPVEGNWSNFFEGSRLT